jgi:two-component system, NtrC family, response regulator HydG
MRMSEIARILVVDDDVSFLEQMPDILEGLGDVDCFCTLDQGIAAVTSKYYDIAILDLNFENEQRTGLDVFKRILALDRGVDVMMITGETDPRRVFELANLGIRRFVTKPIDIEEVREQVEGILADRALRRRCVDLSNERQAGALIGSSAAMRSLRESIAQIVASGTKDILIQGETGTGKEVVAKSIASAADNSGRFLPINCSGLNENLIQSELFGHVKGAFTGADRDKRGIFEAAGGGYVFLDEIGDMPLSQQPKLLRTLQERMVQRVGEVEEKEVSFRTISATHHSLKDAVANGKFREDLYFRISKEVIVVPPLRERIEDLRELVLYFLAKQSKKCSITEDAIRLLQSFDWPGNVRQLESAVEAMAIRCEGVIRPPHVLRVVPELASLKPTEIRQAALGNFGVQLINKEKQRFQKAIIEANGDREKAAARLGIPRSTFYRRAKELGIGRSRRQRSLQLD